MPRSAPKLARWLAFIAMVTAVGVAGVVAFIGRSAWDRVFEDPARLPVGVEAAVVLGNGPTLTDGSPNAHFEARLDAAADLWRSGRVRRVIVSGNNDGHGYDEPMAMRDGLAARGVPMDAVTLDPKGFRTADTVRRAREVFGVDGGTAVFVTDPFHAARTLFLADRAGGPPGSVVFACAEVPWRLSWRSRLREVLADVRALGDVKPR